MADPGFDLRGGGERKSLDVLTCWSKSKFLACIGHNSIITILKNESRAKRATKKLRKISVLGIKNHRSLDPVVLNIAIYTNIIFVAISLWIWNGDTSNRNCEQSQVVLEEASQLKFKYVQLFKAFGITGSFGSVDGICWNIIKQSVHFVHLICVL